MEYYYTSVAIKIKWSRCPDSMTFERGENIPQYFSCFWDICLTKLLVTKLTLALAKGRMLDRMDFCWHDSGSIFIKLLSQSFFRLELCFKIISWDLEFTVHALTLLLHVFCIAQTGLQQLILYWLAWKADPACSYCSIKQQAYYQERADGISGLPASLFCALTAY